MIDVGEILDGRKTRSVRTRQSVVTAVIALQEDEVLRPTARQIAAKAGVSVRSLFQHFPTQESLTEAVIEQLGREMFADIHRSAPAGTLQKRVAAFTRKRCLLLERLVPHRRAAAVYAPGITPRIARRREEVRTLLRDEVAAVFSVEIARLRPPASKQLLQALAGIYEAELWESLRRGQCLPFGQACELLEQLVWGQLLFHFGASIGVP